LSPDFAHELSIPPYWSSEDTVSLRAKRKELKRLPGWWDAIQCDWITLAHWILQEEGARQPLFPTCSSSDWVGSDL